jgi:hypothetical protein
VSGARRDWILPNPLSYLPSDNICGTEEQFRDGAVLADPPEPIELNSDSIPVACVNVQPEDFPLAIEFDPIVFQEAPEWWPCVDSRHVVPTVTRSIEITASLTQWYDWDATSGVTYRVFGTGYFNQYQVQFWRGPNCSSLTPVAAILTPAGCYQFTAGTSERYWMLLVEINAAEFPATFTLTTGPCVA